MDLTPRVCCRGRPAKYVVAEGMLVREWLVKPTIVRRWMVGEINWRTRGAFREQLKLLEAMLEVDQGLSKSN